MRGGAPSSIGLSWRTGVVGVVILVGAALAGFALQSDQVSFPVTWRTDAEPLTQVNRTLPPGESATSIPYNASRANVTWLLAKVNVTAPPGHTGPDPVAVTVEDPTGNATRANGTFPSGSGSLTLAVNRTATDVPTQGTVEAKDPTEARRKLAERHTSNRTTGTWLVHVRVDHDGPPSEHRISVRGAYAVYEAEIGEP